MLNQQQDSIYYDPNYTGRYGYGAFAGFDEENGNGGVNNGRSGSWGRGGQLPSFSSAFGSLANEFSSFSNGHGYGGLGGNADHFFVPSYLRGSKYVQKLEEAHKAKVLAHRDGSAPSSQPNSLSTSASSVNLHAKMVPSHRGRPYDLVEKTPLIEDEPLSPLPSKWSTTDKFGALEVTSDGFEVKLTGPKSMNDRDNEASAIRSDHPMPPQCGIYYFEVTVLSRKREEYGFQLIFMVRTSLTLTVVALLVLGFLPKKYPYQDYRVGNLILGHITVMMAMDMLVQVLGKLMVHHSPRKM